VEDLSRAVLLHLEEACMRLSGLALLAFVVA
jgi:hypothetical protein